MNITLHTNRLVLRQSRGGTVVLGFRLGNPAYLQVFNRDGSSVSCWKLKGSAKRPMFPDAEELDRLDFEAKAHLALRRGLEL